MERERARGEREKGRETVMERDCTSMAMLSSSRMLSNAPTSSHVVSGTVANPSRFAEGCTKPRATYRTGRNHEWPSPTSKAGGNRTSMQSILILIPVTVYTSWLHGNYTTTLCEHCHTLTEKSLEVMNTFCSCSSVSEGCSLIHCTVDTAFGGSSPPPASEWWLPPPCSAGWLPSSIFSVSFISLSTLQQPSHTTKFQSFISRTKFQMETLFPSLLPLPSPLLLLLPPSLLPPLTC